MGQRRLGVVLGCVNIVAKNLVQLVYTPTLLSFVGKADYLPFVPDGKKLAYAVSFGVSEIGSGRERTVELLNGIPSISMRGDAGARIVLEHHRANGLAFDLVRCEDEDWDRLDAILALQRRKSVEWLFEALEAALSSKFETANES